MATYKTPDVYVEEISIFPPSVAEVETCIPAFIGYTAKATKTVAGDLKNVPTRITSMLDYDRYFGGAPKVNVQEVNIDAANSFINSKLSTSYYLYDSLRLFYANGGGDCYIVSVGSYSDTVAKGTYSNDKSMATGLLGGLGMIEMVDEPTILLFPDAVSNSNDLYAVQQQALSQCNKLMDRFCVFDLYKNDPTGEKFRNNIGVNYLKYGSAYTPWLSVSLSKNITYDNIRTGGILKKSGAPVTLQNLTTDPAISALIQDYNSLFTDKTTVNGNALVSGSTFRNNFDAAVGTYSASLASKTPANLKAVFEAIYTGLDLVDDWQSTLTCKKITSTAANSLGVIPQKIANSLDAAWTSLVSLEKELKAEIASYNEAYDDVPPNLSTPLWTAKATPAASTLLDNLLSDTDAMDAAVAIARNYFEQVNTGLKEIVDAVNSLDKTLEDALLEGFPLYKTIIQGINDSATEMPPSGAVVGVYAATDRDRGVWKAPANVSLASVVGPATTFTASQLDALNIDVNAGKSINAIRSFVGKGTLIWGARTLAGNDNEWRYVPVRRFFNTAEESIKKSTYWAVFEPNNGNTWVKVKGMIENYLTNKWKEGALVGAKPDEAFFVRIGLGQTMSAQDILEGYMKVEIGMAVVRPAEFIVLKFSHKLQQS
jgi:phage tail sheath protein FI